MMRIEMDKSVHKAATIKETYLEELQKIRTNYLSDKGQVFSFSGVLNLIIDYGLTSFEEKNHIKIKDLTTKQKVIANGS